MRRVRWLVPVALLLALMPACGGTDRPEGVVEAWLNSLNQGSAGRPERYAPDALSQRILPNWQDRDPGDIDLIEVGKGRAFRSPASFPMYVVPYRVELVDGHVERGVTELTGDAEAGWHVTLLQPAFSDLKVPSEGGDRVGRASIVWWFGAFALAIFFVLITMTLMETVGREPEVAEP